MQDSMMEGANPLTCPFCGFKDENDYKMLLHVEIYHSEDGDSPFAVKDAIEAERSNLQATRSQEDLPIVPASETEYVKCPYKCGEQVHAAELQFHVDFHLAEEMALEEASSDMDGKISSIESNDLHTDNAITDTFNTNIHASLRNHDSPFSAATSPQTPSPRSRRNTPSLKELFLGSSSRKISASPPVTSKRSGTKRLGTTELGPYAHEKRMPSWLQRMLEEGAKVTIYNKIGPDGSLIRTESVANETSNLVNVLAKLSSLDQKVAGAFYCSPEVRHVAKMKDEGGFCGYRNIQMLISYIRDAQAPGYQRFSRRLPSIIKLQDMIEQAWDDGYNSNGRAETGGIRLTRKYIGTSEAQALLQSLKIPCEVAAFFSTPESEAYLGLLQALCDYFDDQTGHSEHIVITDRPPVYFQHRGHSMTIVGIEIQHDGKANLVVFDPMFNPSSGIKRLTDRTNFRCDNPSALLKAHRRGVTYLSRYKTFEILKLSEPTNGS